MKKNKINIFLTIALLLPCMVFAQDADQRSRQMDSLEYLLKTNPPEGVDLARVYRELMYYYVETNTEKSMDYARKCAAISISLNKLDYESNAYNVLGRCFYKHLLYDSSMVYYEKISALTEQMRKYPKDYSERFIDLQVSTNYGNMGNLYNMRGKNLKALEYYQKVLPIFKKYGMNEHLTLAYYNIGEMYLSMDNTVSAEINYIKADSVAQIKEDSMFIAYAKYSLSRLYNGTGNYDKALQNAEKAYDYFFLHPEEGEMKAHVLCSFSDIWLKKGDDRRAEDYALQARQLFEEMGLPDHSFYFLSQIYLKRSQWQKAEQTAIAALAIDVEEPSKMLVLYKVLGKAYAHLGIASKAGEYIDKLTELQSTWSNKNYQSAISEMEVKYETEKKEIQIATLEKEKKYRALLEISGGTVLLLALFTLFFLWRWTVQKKRLSEQQVIQLEREKQLVATQALLDGETQERTRLARDLHDGLGSILAAAKYNLADMKKTPVTELINIELLDKALSLLDESMSEMRRVAHHLMPESLTRYGLKQAMTDFCKTIPSAKFVYYGDEIRLDPKMNVMIYRIMHELASNALKHSGASDILVQIIQESDRIALTVQDNGCGFDAAAESKGMGLANIRTRVAAYNGNLLIDSTIGKGTEINVELQLQVTN